MGKSAPSPPPPPDYAGAAREQGAANEAVARIQGKLNNPNVYSPYGTQIVSFAGDQPTVTQTFSPSQQAIFEAEQANKLGLANLADTGIENVQGILTEPLSYAGAPELPTDSQALRDQIIDAMMARPTRDYEQAKSLRQAELAAAGIPVGSEAYDYEMDLLNRSLNDARNQAILSSGQEVSRQFGIDQALRNQYLTELLSQRQTPINEITALMSGSQVQNPFTIPSYAQNTSVAPPPIFAAANALGNYNADIYNARAAAYGNRLSGLYGLGGALIGAGGSFLGNPGLFRASTPTAF